MKLLLLGALLSVWSPLSFGCTSGATAVRCDPANCNLRRTGNPLTLAAALKAAQIADMCAGSTITVWGITPHPGGYGETYHYFATSVSPPVATSQLTDEGFETDNEQTVIPPLHGNTEGGEWFELIDFLNGAPRLRICSDSFCS